MHGNDGALEKGTAPMQPLNRIDRSEERLASLWERSVTTLGIHTVHVLLDRAIWQTAQRHPNIALIQHDDSGLSFDALEESYATRPQEEIAAAFDDLSAEMLLLLARLLGWEIAQRLAEDLAVTDVPERTSASRPYGISCANHASAQELADL
jgi:hypothetical protein